METIYRCELCGYESADLDEVKEDEESHNDPHQMEILATSGYNDKTRAPRQLVVKDSEGELHEYHLYKLGVTEDQKSVDGNKWKWKKDKKP